MRGKKGMNNPWGLKNIAILGSDAQENAMF